MPHVHQLTVTRHTADNWSATCSCGKWSSDGNRSQMRAYDRWMNLHTVTAPDTRNRHTNRRI